MLGFAAFSEVAPSELLAAEDAAAAAARQDYPAGRNVRKRNLLVDLAERYEQQNPQERAPRQRAAPVPLLQRVAPSFVPGSGFRSGLLGSEAPLARMLGQRYTRH